MHKLRSLESLRICNGKPCVLQAALPSLAAPPGLASLFLDGLRISPWRPPG